MFGMYPFLRTLYAEAIKARYFAAPWQKYRRLNVEIVERSNHANGPVVLPDEGSLGSGYTGVSPKIGRISTERRSHFYASLGNSCGSVAALRD